MVATRSTMAIHGAPSSNSDDEDKTQSQNHRLFTESDETKLLKTYLKLVAERASTTKTKMIVVTTPDMDDIEASLKHRFSHNQIIDKLRRLRLKYHRHARTKSLVKTPHDHKLFFISRKIWGRTKTTSNAPERHEPGPASRSVREEMGQALGGNPVWEAGLGRLGRERVEGMDREWVLLCLEETELATRRAKLVNESVELVLKAIVASSS